MDGLERIEVAVRMQIGYVLGRTSPFAHADPGGLTEAFMSEGTDPASGEPTPSSYATWLQRVDERRAHSDERFVAHFREEYDDRMPVGALTEILERGQLSVLYRGLLQQDAEEIALAFGVPTKKLMVSWLASSNVLVMSPRWADRRKTGAGRPDRFGGVFPLCLRSGASAVVMKFLGASG
ncbi:Abi family protein [Rhodococcus rhodochrous]|uniref:Abi family protein n=1 Tax=Rhodococcus rhodochrous TaxID=1829 RepID=A0AA46X1L1_RHORH|nr:Abi family protein [Rhodococcus rhodochrous]UZF48375.1 Abi family protein [Rhodococcus rhodochrous]